MAKNRSALSSIEIRPALEADLPAIEALLRDSDLPADDAGEHWRTFLVAVSGDDIVGTVGLEITGSSGLLRSLAVAKEIRGRGVGMTLYQAIVDRARGLGISELGLLTTTAEGFFSRVGFHKLQAAGIPPYISQSKEYKIYCPSTAVIMTKAIV